MPTLARTLACLMFVLPPLGSEVKAQSGTLDLAAASSFALDFSVPRSPAFKLLEVDASKILRPSSTRELAGALSGFGSTGTSITLPKNIGIEFAPALMIKGPTLSRDEYASQTALYRLRASIATSRPDSATSATSLSFGVRTSVFDDADLRSNDNFILLAEQFQAEVVGAADRLEGGILATLDTDVATAATLADAIVGTLKDTSGGLSAAWERADSIVRAAGVSREQAEALARLVRQAPDVDRSRLNQVKDSLQNELWNANALDLAFAGLATSGDSTATGLKMRTWAVWGTWSKALGSNAQLLLGGRAATESKEEGEEGEDRESGWQSSATMSARVYFGSNDLKAFVEGQGEARDGATPVWLLNSGGEFRPGFGGWFKFAAGMEWDQDTDAGELVTSFSFNFGLPNPIGL